MQRSRMLQEVDMAAPQMRGGCTGLFGRMRAAAAAAEGPQSGEIYIYLSSSSPCLFSGAARDPLHQRRWAAAWNKCQTSHGSGNTTAVSPEPSMIIQGREVRNPELLLLRR